MVALVAASLAAISACSPDQKSVASASHKPVVPRLDRCAGSYEPEKCRLAEEKLAAESDEEAKTRAARLNAERDKNAAIVAAAPVERTQPEQLDLRDKNETSADPVATGPRFSGGRVDAACNQMMAQLGQRYGATYACWPGYLSVPPERTGSIIVTANGLTPEGVLHISFPADANALGNEAAFQYNVDEVNQLVMRMRALHNGLSPAQVQALRAQLR
jgi:hypothetical protein